MFKFISLAIPVLFSIQAVTAQGSYLANYYATVANCPRTPLLLLNSAPSEIQVEDIQQAISYITNQLGTTYSGQFNTSVQCYGGDPHNSKNYVSVEIDDPIITSAELVTTVSDGQSSWPYTLCTQNLSQAGSNECSALASLGDFTITVRLEGVSEEQTFSRANITLLEAARWAEQMVGKVHQGSITTKRETASSLEYSVKDPYHHKPSYEAITINNPKVVQVLVHSSTGHVLCGYGKEPFKTTKGTYAPNCADLF